MNEFTVKMPILVELGKKKKRKYYLNLNLLRNRVAHLNNNVKREYARIAHGVLPPPPDKPWEKFELEYKLFLPNKLKRDISNVLSIVDKNFCDALITHGWVEDDNYQHLQKVVYLYGGQDDSKNGYVEITVRRVEDE
jgi:hypothetical protein